MKTTKHKSKFVTPYNEQGKPNFSRAIYSRMAGVYIIKEDGKPVYVGYSENNLYRTMYRHFQKWTHRQQVVVSYIDRFSRHLYTVRILITVHSEAKKWEAFFIDKLKPRDNYREPEIEIIYTPGEQKQMNEIYKRQEEEPPF